MAFLFAHPDSDAMRTLDVRGHYFDIRTGDTWDLFFPGYYKATDADLEGHVGARPVGKDFGRQWFFHPGDFDILRRHVEDSSEHSWTYSGGTDLVLVNAWLSSSVDPEIDWASIQSGSLTESSEGTQTMTVAQVVEAITRDLQSGMEDASYGVGSVVQPPTSTVDSDRKKVMIGALGGIAAAIGKKGLGI